MSFAGLFRRLRDGAGPLWTEFVEHPFVLGLGDGTLPTPAFRRYLTQDYLFLIQFARAYALAGYKAGTVADLRAASAGFAAILDELPLHVSVCARWGITERQMAAETEAMETVAYTRFVLDCESAGDLLDLYAALAPCVLGYAEIGQNLGSRQTAGNRYAAWIETYAGSDYQASASLMADTLDRLWTERGGDNRLPGLRQVQRGTQRRTHCLVTGQRAWLIQQEAELVRRDSHLRATTCQAAVEHGPQHHGSQRAA